MLKHQRICISIHVKKIWSCVGNGAQGRFGCSKKTNRLSKCLGVMEVDEAPSICFSCFLSFDNRVDEASYIPRHGSGKHLSDLQLVSGYVSIRFVVEVWSAHR